MSTEYERQLKNYQEFNDVCELMDKYKNELQIDVKTKNKIYNRAKSIIDHNWWYTDKQRQLINQKASVLHFFTKKQKKALTFSSIQKNNENYEKNNERYDDGATSDEDRRWCD